MTKVLNFDEFSKKEFVKESIDFTGMEEPECSICRICPPVGDVIGYVTDCLKKHNLAELVDEYVEKSVGGDYNMLLMLSIEYLNKCNNESNPIVNCEVEEPVSDETEDCVCGESCCEIGDNTTVTVDKDSILDILHDSEKE